MSALFDLAATALETHSSLDALESRGTLRIALRAGGLDVESLEPTQLQAVFEHLMPEHLSKRGIADPRRICHAVLQDVARAATDTAPPSRGGADRVLRRLGGD